MINLNRLRCNDDWSFSDIKRSQSLYASHGYHRYPAKFIPQLVRKIILQYSVPKDIVFDPFGGCGTTLVESRLNMRNSIGIDINKVAVLITKAKIRDVDVDRLALRNKALLESIANKVAIYDNKPNFFESANPRLQYWFKPEQYNRLQLIYGCILKENDRVIRHFYKCCFSNILKNCSIWYSKSIKPMRDLDKKVEDPIKAFTRHLNYMTKRNEEFRRIVKMQTPEEYLFCKMRKDDARRIQISDNYVDLVVTSPPYVTSYEYAELHQLSTLWFHFAEDIKEVKRNFIGTESRKIKRNTLESETAKETILELAYKNKAISRHVSNYYHDMLKCFKEIYRVLKPGKYFCLILGDTEFLGTKIQNTKVSLEQLKAVGFKHQDIIKRKLSSKIFTPFRDKTGKFTNSKNGEKRTIYQYEYIIVAKK